MHISSYFLDDYECLGQLGDLFEEVSDRIPAWGPGGQIFTDFYHIKKRLEEIGDDDEVCVSHHKHLIFISDFPLLI